MRTADDEGSRPRAFRRRLADVPCISQDDLAILRFVGDQYVIDDGQLTRLRGKSPNTNRAWRRRYRKAGLLMCSELLPRQVCSWLTQAGLDFCGLDYRYLKPATGKLEHNLAVGHARLNAQAKLKAQGKEFVWVPERQLYTELARGAHMPDGEILLGGGKRVAVEVELTLKRKERMAAIFAELVSRYDQVLAWCRPSPFNQLQDQANENGWSGVQLIDFDKDIGEVSR